jgi:hypothetical protein
MNVLTSDVNHAPAMPSARRFPPPWTVEDNGACFIVNAQRGQRLAYVSYAPSHGAWALNFDKLPRCWKVSFQSQNSSSPARFAAIPASNR